MATDGSINFVHTSCAAQPGMHEPHPHVQLCAMNRACSVEQSHVACGKPIETMGFGNLKSDGGLRALNDYLTERSYIEG